VLLSLPTRPEVSIDCSIAYGEVTRVPWLRSELERSLQQQITVRVRGRGRGRLRYNPNPHPHPNPRLTLTLTLSRTRCVAPAATSARRSGRAPSTTPYSRSSR
jgi:hypothetical protein